MPPFFLIFPDFSIVRVKPAVRMADEEGVACDAASRERGATKKSKRTTLG
jgi:hypothetical protein